MFDRVQTTNMHFSYNEKQDTFFQKATLFGAWPKGQGTEFSNRGFIFNQNETDWKTTCGEILVSNVSIGLQPPWWPTLGHAKIEAIIKKPDGAPDFWVSPLTGSNRTVVLIRVSSAKNRKSIRVGRKVG